MAADLSRVPVEVRERIRELEEELKEGGPHTAKERERERGGGPSSGGPGRETDRVVVEGSVAVWPSEGPACDAGRPLDI